MSNDEVLQSYRLSAASTGADGVTRAMEVLEPMGRWLQSLSPPLTLQTLLLGSVDLQSVVDGYQSLLGQDHPYWALVPAAVTALRTGQALTPQLQRIAQLPNHEQDLLLTAVRTSGTGLSQDSLRIYTDHILDIRLDAGTGHTLFELASLSDERAKEVCQEFHRRTGKFVHRAVNLLRKSESVQQQRSLSRADEDSLGEFLKKLKSSGLNPRSASNMGSSVRKFVKWIVKQGGAGISELTASNRRFNALLAASDYSSNSHVISHVQRYRQLMPETPASDWNPPARSSRPDPGEEAVASGAMERAGIPGVPPHQELPPLLVDFRNPDNSRDRMELPPLPMTQVPAEHQFVFQSAWQQIAAGTAPLIHTSRNGELQSHGFTVQLPPQSIGLDPQLMGQQPQATLFMLHVRDGRLVGLGIPSVNGQLDVPVGSSSEAHAVEDLADPMQWDVPLEMMDLDLHAGEEQYGQYGDDGLLGGGWPEDDDDWQFQPTLYESITTQYPEPSSWQSWEPMPSAGMFGAEPHGEVGQASAPGRRLLPASAEDRVARMAPIVTTDEPRFKQRPNEAAEVTPSDNEEILGFRRNLVLKGYQPDSARMIASRLAQLSNFIGETGGSIRQFRRASFTHRFPMDKFRKWVGSETTTARRIERTLELYRMHGGLSSGAESVGRVPAGAPPLDDGSLNEFEQRSRVTGMPPAVLEQHMTHLTSLGTWLRDHQARGLDHLLSPAFDPGTTLGEFLARPHADPAQVEALQMAVHDFIAVMSSPVPPAPAAGS